jgi:hypothetical protein
MNMLGAPKYTVNTEPEVQAAEDTLPEASIVEGEYSAEVEEPSRVVVVAC